MILFCVQSPAQTGPAPTITRIQADFVQVRKTLIGASAAIPPTYFYRIEGYDYVIKLEIFQPDSALEVSSAFGIVCLLPNGSIWQFPIVEFNLSSASIEILEYSLPLEIQIEGWYKFLLASNDELKSSVHPRFYQHVSNTQTVYLHTPPG